MVLADRHDVPGTTFADALAQVKAAYTSSPAMKPARGTPRPGRPKDTDGGGKARLVDPAQLPMSAHRQSSRLLLGHTSDLATNWQPHSHR